MSKSYLKIFTDWLFKAYLHGRGTVPAGLVDFQKYFRNFGPIKFTFHHEDGTVVAVSDNFRYGSIVTFAENEKELDEKIKDAILTAFGIPSSYAKEADIRREEADLPEYAAA